jgi:hypothetical protein
MIAKEITERNGASHRCPSGIVLATVAERAEKPEASALPLT